MMDGHRMEVRTIFYMAQTLNICPTMTVLGTCFAFTLVDSGRRRRGWTRIGVVGWEPHIIQSDLCEF